MIYEVILYSFYIFRGGSTSIHAPDAILYGQTWWDEEIYGQTWWAYGQTRRWHQENQRNVSQGTTKLTTYTTTTDRW